MPIDKDFMFRFATKLKSFAQEKRNKSSYCCSECGAEVKVNGEEKIYTCEHVNATIIGQMSAVARGQSKLRSI